jgi:HEAT repeat protein
LIDALRDKDLHLGIAAAEELANVAGRKTLAALLDALKDQQLVAHVRAAAARALGKIGGEEALSALLSALDDESEIPRWSAAEALGRIGGEQAITGLAKALQDHDITVRWRAVQALGKIGGDRPVTLLLNLLEDKRETSPFVLSEIAKVLGELGDRRAMPVLADVLGDDRGLGESGEWFRKRARAALEQLAGRPAMANALSGIEDKNFNRMRESWANILANESGGGKFGVLLSMAGSTDPRMQISFWEVLLRMDVPQVASGLVQALHEDDDAVRRKAAEVIGYYRRDESTCRELSRLGSHDPIDSVKVAARTALEQINFARQWLVQRMV